MAKPSITKFECSTNYLVIDVGWGNPLLVPYKDGLKFLEAVKYAEVLENRHDENHTKLKSVPLDNVKVSLFPESRRNDIKSAQVLGISLKEYIDAK